MAREQLDFYIDNTAVVKQFLSELPLQTFRYRFGNCPRNSIFDYWRPEHTLIVACNGKMLALADVIRTSDLRVGNFSLVSKENCTLYGFIALLQIKNLFPAETVETTFSTPNKILVELAKRWADVVYDQETWAVARELTIRYGGGSFFAPTPITLTRKNLEVFGIPDVTFFDEISKKQTVYSCLNENKAYIKTKKYGLLPRAIIVALSFDILDFELEKRQLITRELLGKLIVKSGLKLSSRTFYKKKNYDSHQNFLAELDEYMSIEAPPLTGPIFELMRLP